MTHWAMAGDFQQNESKFHGLPPGCVQLNSESLDLDLRRLIGDDFWNSFVVADFPGYADMLAPVRLFGVTKLRPISSQISTVNT